MFKRWRKKEMESERPIEPSSSNEASGFICPMCMVAFDSPDELQIHFVMAHAETKATPEIKDFVCPMCTSAFNSSSELQSHFDKEHDTDDDLVASSDVPLQESAGIGVPQQNRPTKIRNEEQGSLITLDKNVTANRKESEVSLLSTSIKEIEEKTQEVMNLQQELNDVNASLKEEKWYSAALKEEVEKITEEKNNFQQKCKDQKKEKHDMEENFTQKLMEEKEKNVKSMAEFAQLKVELARAVESHTGTQSEQKDLAFRSSQLAAANAGLQAKLNEEISSKGLLSDELGRLKEQLDERNKLNESLENQLAQRPSGSEIVSLQSKISSLQQEIIALKQEKESEQRQWQEKYNGCLQQLNDLQIKVKELEVEKASKTEQIESLHTAISASTESRKQTQTQSQEQQQQIINLQHNLSKSEVCLKEKETFIEYLQKQQHELQTKFQSEVNSKDSISQQARNLQNQVEESQRQLENRNTKVDELEMNLSHAKEDVSRLQTERADLISKIEAGEGTETAITQIKQEKEQLQARLSQAETLAQTQINDYLKKIEEMHQRNNKAEDDLAKSTDKSSRLKSFIEEIKQQLDEAREKNEQLSLSLREKSEGYAALEAAKAAEKSVLDNQLKSIQETLQEKLIELSALHQQNGQIKKDLSASLSSQANLETKNQSLVSDLDLLRNKSSQLKLEVNQKAANISHLEQIKAEEKSSLEKQLQQLKMLSENKDRLLIKTQQEWDKNKEALSLRIKGLEIQQEQLTQSLSLAQHNIEDREANLHDIEKECQKVKEENANLQGQYAMIAQSLQEKSAEMIRETSHLNEENKSLREKISEQVETNKHEMSNLMSTLKGVKERLEQAKVQNEEKDRLLQQQKEQISQLSTDLSEAQDAMMELGEAHQIKITNMETEMNAKIKQRDSFVAEMQSRLDQKDEKLNEQQRKVEVLEAELQKQCESCKNYESQLCKAQISLKEEQEKIHGFESQLLILTSEIQALQGQISSGENELQRVRIKSEETESTLRLSVEQLNEVKNNLELKLMNLDNELKEEKEKVSTLTSEKKNLETELAKQASALIDQRENLESEIAKSQSTLEFEREKNAKELEESQQKQQLLISQKLELENQLTSIKQDLAKSQEDHQESKEVSKRVQMVLNEEKTALQTKLNNEIKDKKELQEQSEQVKARLNMQIASLTENLSAAKASAMESDKKAEENQNKLAEEEKKSDALRGEIAVLEATVQNNIDERRKLLERCVAGEENVEKMKKDVHIGKKKLEESQAAMMELTQENQNLQILNNQMSTRRWEVDEDVTNCNSCDKSFSFAIRKHHCRNCGLIFCNECTAKTATIASSKKPVRVCDSCYNEVTTGSIKKYQLQPNQGFT